MQGSSRGCAPPMAGADGSGAGETRGTATTLPRIPAMMRGAGGQRGESRTARAAGHVLGPDHDSRPLGGADLAAAHPCRCEPAGDVARGTRVRRAGNGDHQAVLLGAALASGPLDQRRAGLAGPAGHEREPGEGHQGDHGPEEERVRAPLPTPRLCAGSADRATRHRRTLVTLESRESAWITGRARASPQRAHQGHRVRVRPPAGEPEALVERDGRGVARIHAEVHALGSDGRPVRRAASRSGPGPRPLALGLGEQVDVQVGAVRGRPASAAGHMGADGAPRSGTGRQASRSRSASSAAGAGPEARATTASRRRPRTAVVSGVPSTYPRADPPSSIATPATAGCTLQVGALRRPRRAGRRRRAGQTRRGRRRRSAGRSGTGGGHRRGWRRGSRPGSSHPALRQPETEGRPPRGRAPLCCSGEG